MATTQTKTTNDHETQDAPAMPRNPVGYSELQTTDPVRARTFYTTLFGWKPEEEQTPMGPYTAFPGLLVGMTAPRDGVPPGWVPYIDVADVAAATKRARELDGQVLRDCITIPDGTFSVVRDPTGGVFGLFQKR
jgi:predicted enzyme related to lactoylglutathione lyase